MLLENKVAIVTGAARGIGLAAAARLGREGARIVMADLDERELKRSADALRERGRQVLDIKCDVGSRDDVVRMVRTAQQEFGDIDIRLKIEFQEG